MPLVSINSVCGIITKLPHMVFMIITMEQSSVLMMMSMISPDVVHVPLPVSVDSGTMLVMLLILMNAHLRWNYQIMVNLSLLIL